MGQRKYHRRPPFNPNKKRHNRNPRMESSPDGFRIHTNKRVRKLNMRRLADFKWDLSLILKEVPEESIAAVKGGIYAKASKIGMREARDFIGEKEKEGIITPDTALKLSRLLQRYSVFR